MRCARLAALAAIAWIAAAPCAPAHEDLAKLAFQPHPGAQLPLSSALRDEHGDAVRLGQYFGRKPVVLLLEYLRCKSLCALTLRNMVTALDALPLDPGRDFQFLVVSIDPRDTPEDAAAAKATYMARYTHPGVAAGVHFLTGRKTVVRHIADTIGFPYQWDADQGEYVHPAGFVFAAPDGKISTYIIGVTVTPGQMSAGLHDAAQGKALSPLTRLLLFCHVIGAPFGRFTAPVIATITVTNLLATAVLLVIFVTIRRRRHR